MRLTRSQLRAEAAKIHADDTATSEVSVTLLRPGLDEDRSPLTETPANVTQDAPLNPALDKMPDNASKPSRTRRGKGEKKGMRTDEENVDESPSVPELPEDDRLSAGSRASGEAIEELNRDNSGDSVQVTVSDESSEALQSSALHAVKGQLAEQEQDRPQSQPQRHQQLEGLRTNIEVDREQVKSPHDSPVEPEPRHSTLESNLEQGEPKSMIGPDFELRGRHALGELTMDDRFISSGSSSGSPARSATRMSSSIEAIDALEEALEDIHKSIPHIRGDKSRRSSGNNVRLSVNSQPLGESDSDSEDLPTQKVSAAPKGVKSIKENAKPRKLSDKVAPAPAQKLTLSRSSSVKATSSSRDSSAKAKARVPGEVVDYLASKRRPISMSFPAPPPPPKSSKPPTRPSFTLPGEIVAAKLKAQREERLRREEEEAKAAQPPPPPRRSGPLPVPTFSLPGEAISAKLRAQREERLKREEEEAARRREFKARSVPNFSAPAAVRETKSSKARQSLMHDLPEAVEQQKPVPVNNSKRVSIGSAPSTRPRVPSSLSREVRPPVTVKPGPVVKSAVSAADVAVQREKGKQIFNRDKMEKERREQEKREKEEAAKRARAEAAERSRQLSREWAEKQRKKLLSEGTGKAAIAS